MRYALAMTVRHGQNPIPVARWILGRPGSLAAARMGLASRLRRARLSGVYAYRSPLHPLTFGFRTESGADCRLSIDVWSDPMETERIPENSKNDPENVQ